MAMIFKPYGKLSKHDIGAVFDKEYIGTAMLCSSSRHVSISVNIQDFVFASKCVQYLYCRNSQNKTLVIPMEQAKQLFINGRQLNGGEFKIIEWEALEDPTQQHEIPF